MNQPRLRIRILITATLVVAAIVAIVLIYLRQTRYPWTRDGQVVADIVWITPRVEGEVVMVAVVDNQSVAAGELLFEIDPRDYELQVQSARVALTEARQNVASLEASVVARDAGVAEAQAGILTAEAQVAAAQAGVENARALVDSSQAGLQSAQAYIDQSIAELDEAVRERDRAQRLADEGAGSVQNAESKAAAAQAARAVLDNANAQALQAQATLEQSQASLRQAQADLQASQMSVGEAEARLASAMADREQALADLGSPGEQNTLIEAARVDLANAELRLSWTRVYAPSDGYVTNLNVDVGDYATPAAPLLAFVDSSTFRVEGFFRETQLRHIQPGDSAVVTLMSYPDQPIYGVVDSIGWAINPPDIATTEGVDGLVPQIQPSFDWIRLAQRVPVRIHLTNVPEGVPLVSGVTASVAIRPTE